tara:strand:- start:939 stop:1358 length:420 start_codon:yes stop_codon:yes gene_type:complete
MAHTIGCIFDHGRRTVEELDRDVVEFAIAYGYKASEEYATGLASHSDSEYDESQALTEEADEAIDYLNGLDGKPAYTHYGNDGEAGAFGLWPDVEGTEEQWTDDSIVHATEAPEYIRVVNDHGNVTLYKVTLAEVWSVV